MLKKGQRNFKGCRVAVVGLGLEGRDAVSFFLKQGSSVTIFDQKEKSEIDLSDFDADKLNLVCGQDYLDHGFLNFDIVVRSPGVYRYLPQFVEAEKKGVEITSVVKLFFELAPAKTIGVTGTKGKGTTSTLVYEILKASGKTTFLIGNIGKPCLEILPLLDSKSVVVMELSSFQLIDLTQSPNVAVVLNVTVDHLDWHKNRREYVAAKMNIVKHQKKQ